MLQHFAEPLDAELFIHTSHDGFYDEWSLYNATGRLAAIRTLPVPITPDQYLDDLSGDPPTPGGWRSLFVNKTGNAYGGVLGRSGANFVQLTHHYGCGQLIREAERRRGMQYKYVAFSRSDYMWFADAPPLALMPLRPRGVYIPCVQNDYGGFCDHFVLGDRQSIVGWFDGLRHIAATTVPGQILMTTVPGGAKSNNAERMLAHFLLQVNQVNVTRFPDVAFRICACNPRTKRCSRQNNGASACRWRKEIQAGAKKSKQDLDNALVYGTWIKRCGWSDKLMGYHNFSSRRATMARDNLNGACTVHGGNASDNAVISTGFAFSKLAVKGGGPIGELERTTQDAGPASIQLPRVAAVIVGDLRVGVAKPVADKIQQYIIAPNHADVFMCVSDGVYEEIGSAINESSYGYVPQNGWRKQYPTLRGLKWRQRLVDPGFSTEEAPCMAGNSRPNTRFRRFWPMFKGWECGVDLMREHEAAVGFEYDFVIRLRPDIGVVAPTLLPEYLLNTQRGQAGADMVTGLAYYHNNLMCDHMHFATRRAADVLSTVFKAVEHCNSLTFGGQQCCGGQPLQEPWSPPGWCNMPHTMVNETECMIDRWLRTNAIRVDNRLAVPGGKILVYRWASDMVWTRQSLTQPPLIGTKCPWK